MNCARCGAELLKGAKFCSKCGAALPREHAVPYGERPTGPQVPTRVLLAVGMAAAGVAGLAVLGFLLTNPFAGGDTEIGTTPVLSPTRPPSTLTAEPTAAPSPTPTVTPKPASLTDVAAVAARGGHTCGVIQSGGVKCWGGNNYGQLGDGTITDRSTPVDVVGLGGDVAAVAGGFGHNCALTTAGGVKCWGLNDFGQLGGGTTTDRSAPLDVAGLESGVAAITPGGWHTCALTTVGGVKCWGRNGHGQLGDGTTTDRASPVDVVGLGSDVVAVAAGYFHTCALTTAGSIRCWGQNDGGQLGADTTDLCTTDRPLGRFPCSTTPLDVVGLDSGVAAVAAGAWHTCGLTTVGGVKCWGGNNYGQLGDGSTTGNSTPVDVTGLESGVAAVAAGYWHTCALTTAASGVRCWGANKGGQLGDRTTVNRTTPVVPLPTGVAAISAGYSHTCALTAEGGVKCWGANDYGQLGDGTTTSSATPVDVVEAGPAR